jgi:transcriptional regulator with XRE-family HTH domain
MPSLGETIRAARLTKGMTVRGMAKAIRVGRSSASEIEGDRWIPSERILLEVAAALGLDFDRLMVLAGRTRKDAKGYLRRHPVAGQILRTLVERDVGDEGLRELLEHVERIGPKAGEDR